MQRAFLSVIMLGRRHEIIVLKPKVKPGCPKKSQPGLQLHFVVHFQEEKLILAIFSRWFCLGEGDFVVTPTHNHNLSKVGVTKIPNVCEFHELSS